MSAAALLRFLAIADRVGPDRLARLAFYALQQEQAMNAATLAFTAILASLAALSGKEVASAQFLEDRAEELETITDAATAEAYLASDDLATLQKASSDAMATAKAATANAQGLKDFLAKFPASMLPPAPAPIDVAPIQSASGDGVEKTPVEASADGSATPGAPAEQQALAA